jgi:hypothetical protein
VAETLRGGGVLLRDKRPELVAELVHQVASDATLRAKLLETQARAIAAIRATDFGDLLRQRLRPVLER